MFCFTEDTVCKLLKMVCCSHKPCALKNLNIGFVSFHQSLSLICRFRGFFFYRKTFGNEICQTCQKFQKMEGVGMLFRVFPFFPSNYFGLFLMQQVLHYKCFRCEWRGISIFIYLSLVYVRKYSVYTSVFPNVN